MAIMRSLQRALQYTGAMIRSAVHDEVGLYEPRSLGPADMDMWARLCMRHEIHGMPDELVAAEFSTGVEI